MTMVVVTHEMGFARTRGRPGRVHGRRPDRRGGHPRGVLHQPAHRRGPRTSSARSSPTDPRGPAARAGTRAHHTQEDTQMKLGRMTVTAVAATAALGLAACGELGTSGSTGSGGRRPGQDRHQVRPAGPRPQGGVGLHRHRRRRGHATSPRSSATWAPPTSSRPSRPSARRSSPPARSSTIVGTYSITDARKEKVSFAGPYFIAGQDLLVRSRRHRRSPARTR